MDAMRVIELQDLQSQLPEGSQIEICKEDFLLIPTDLHLHRCPYKSLLPPVETPQVLQGLETIREIFPADYLEKFKRVFPFCKSPRPE